jgi:hypothetical protein
VEFTDLKLTSRAPLTPEKINACIGEDCWLTKPDWPGYKQYVVVAAEPTNDPYEAAVQVEPKRVWRF